MIYSIGDTYSFDDLEGEVSFVCDQGIYVMDCYGEEHFVPLTN